MFGNTSIYNKMKGDTSERVINNELNSFTQVVSTQAGVSKDNVQNSIVYLMGVLLLPSESTLLYEYVRGTN